ncbi:MAG: aminodeoxychorismate/anthranilate synthase component II [Gemmatimonadetes bacterium]|nr:aminodeoxychorismate/anthranilate synthase component II [Gemmatimonadota bacterium]
MLLVIDNYDSFTFNLAQYLGEQGKSPHVVRNDALDATELAELRPSHVVVSPGPCTPGDAGVSIEAFRRLGRTGTPMLGVCLGHQALGEAFGGRTIRARRTMHGRVGRIRHDGSGIFRGLPSPFTAARYHSLVSDSKSLPDELVAVAWSDESDDRDEVQAMRHRELPLWGVQFHPESLFSDHGRDLLRAFLELQRSGNECTRRG